MKYEIGQALFRASFEVMTERVICPDCGGTGRIRVTFHDETQVSIDCANCAKGYDPPRGYLCIHVRKPCALPVFIKGCEIDGDKVEWRTSDSYRVPESNLFFDRESCLARAAEMAAQFDREERERVLHKEKDTRTWAWNASYHRKCIKEAQRQIEYHTAKLNVASVKSKEDRRADAAVKDAE